MSIPCSVPTDRTCRNNAPVCHSTIHLSRHEQRRGSVTIGYHGRLTRNTNATDVSVEYTRPCAERPDVPKSRMHPHQHHHLQRQQQRRRQIGFLSRATCVLYAPRYGQDCDQIRHARSCTLATGARQQILRREYVTVQTCPAVLYIV